MRDSMKTRQLQVQKELAWLSGFSSIRGNTVSLIQSIIQSSQYPIQTLMQKANTLHQAQIYKSFTYVTSLPYLSFQHQSREEVLKISSKFLLKIMQKYFKLFFQMDKNSRACSQNLGRYCTLRFRVSIHSKLSIYRLKGRSNKSLHSSKIRPNNNAILN